VDQASVGRWKQLSRDTVARLAAICNPTLQLCGYDPVAVDSDDRSADDARRRYEIGLLLQGMKKTPGSTPAATPRRGKTPTT